MEGPDWSYNPAPFTDFSAPFEMNNTYPPYNSGIIDLAADDRIPSKKRSRIEYEDEDTPNKLPKLSDPEYVKDLETQIQELHEFIISQNLMSTAPLSIRKHLEKRSSAAKDLDATIRAKIRQAYKAVNPPGNGYVPPKKSGITSDDYSEAMVNFIPDIERLSDLKGGLELAFRLVIYLGSHSYADLECGGSGEGERPSDEEADELLCELAERMKAEKEGWVPTKELEKLEKDVKHLKDYGIDSFFPKGLKLLSSYVRGT